MLTTLFFDFFELKASTIVPYTLKHKSLGEYNTEVFSLAPLADVLSNTGIRVDMSNMCTNSGICYTQLEPLQDLIDVIKDVIASTKNAVVLLSLPESTQGNTDIQEATKEIRQIVFPNAPFIGNKDITKYILLDLRNLNSCVKSRKLTL